MSFSEDDLIAYHLHVMEPQREDELRRALQHDPELATASEAAAATLGLLKDTFKVPDDETRSGRLWHSLRPSLTTYPSRAVWPRWRSPLLVIASLVLLIGTSMTFIPRRTSQRQASLPASSSRTASALSPTFTETPLKTSALQPLHRSTLALVAATSLFAHPAPAQEKPLPPSTMAVLSSPAVLPVLPSATPEPEESSSNTPIQNATVAAATSRQSKPGTKDLSLGVFGEFIAARNPGTSTSSGTNSRSQSATPAIGVFAAFHQQFNPHLGYEVSTGYTRFNFNYTYGASNNSSAFFERGSIRTDMYQLTGAYVLQKRHTRRLSTRLGAGGGMLAFVPVGSNQPDSYVFRPTGTAAVGAQYDLGAHWAVRAEYRGLFFKGPDFRYTGGTIPVTTRYTLSSQPTVSLTYTFGAHSKE